MASFTVSTVVGDASPHGFASVVVTAANSRSVWTSPSTGWVTVLAGLLARGSLSCVRPSRFPSGLRTGRRTRRSQLRGQPRTEAKNRRSVFPFASPFYGEPAHENTCPETRTSQARRAASSLGQPRVETQGGRPCGQPPPSAGIDASRRVSARGVRCGPLASRSSR